MAIGNKKSPRRREVRRTVPKRDTRLHLPLDRKQLAWTGLYVFAFAVVAGAIARSGRQPDYHLGQKVRTAIVSRVNFTTEDKLATDDRRERAYNKSPNVYQHNPALFQNLNQFFNGLIELAKYESLDTIPEKGRDLINNDEKVLAELRSMYDGDHPKEKWNESVAQLVRDVFDLAILSGDRAAIERRVDSPESIVIQHPDPVSKDLIEQQRFEKVIYSTDGNQSEIRKVIDQRVVHFPTKLRSIIADNLMERLEPTYQYDDAESMRRKDAARQAVKPEMMLKEVDDVLVASGATLEESHLQLLNAERADYINSRPLVERLFRVGGQFGFMAIVAIGIWVYILSYKDRIGRNPMRGLALTCVLLGCQALAVGIAKLAPGALFASATFPTVLAVVILAIAYDQRFALALGAMHSLIVTYSLNMPAGFLVVLIVGIGIALVQLTEVRTRSKLVFVGVWSGAAMAVATFIWGVAGREFHIEGFAEGIEKLLVDCGLAALSGLAVGMFVQGVLPMIEKVFKVTTAMTLRELNDASHPLLQRLAQAAPGTYQHSLRLADITESAADAIGANGLLCRVGAMYHDIGKMNKPAYFIENQGGGPNRHNKLSPAMSVLIIVGHVKDGIEMAREFGLPRELKHFIESHHGSTLVEYFFHAAKKEREQNDQPAPTEFEFRYPGPKPQTKEAAILMLGDSIESAARTLDDPTPARIEQLVHKIAQKRLMDRQFDECNLTLQELHKIESAMTKMLCAVYHSRIKYPAGERSAAKEERPAPAAAAAT